MTVRGRRRVPARDSAECMVFRLTADASLARHVVCFPHAGGDTATYLPWVERLEERAHLWAAEGRARGVPPEQRWSVQIRRYADDLERLAGDLVLYGHSMGTLLAYETVRELRRRGRTVGHLVVSGRAAPHVPTESPVPDDPAELVRRVAARYGGVPDEVLAEPDLLAMVGEGMRVDFLAHNAYTWAPEEPLDTPVTAIAGRDDPAVSADGLRQWGDHTTGRFTAEVVPGAHFLDGQGLARLLAALDPAQATP